MDNQHKKIVGYRDLSQVEINQMNAIKEQGELLEMLINEMKEQGNPDPRWLSIGRTDLQKGIMALVRSIAKPTTF